VTPGGAVALAATVHSLCRQEVDSTYPLTARLKRRGTRVARPHGRLGQQ
jgi:hypothetical protein